MKSLRPEEDWARQLIASAFGVPVVQHDDGSEAGMHDLDVLHADGSVGAVEVTSAADGDSMALWRLMNDRDERWIVTGLAGGWMVSLVPEARGRRVWKELPDLLLELEAQGLKELPGRPGGGAHPDSHLATVAHALGVARAHQSGTDFPGSIYITLHRRTELTGGFVADTSDALVGWLGEFLALPAQGDVRAKLGRSTAPDRHAFVIVPGFATAPFSVTDPLMRDDAPLPTIDPRLPPEITDVWAASTWRGGAGFRWSTSTGWARFDKA
jgi:hypothetical protein